MVSNRKLSANRTNAKRSTGPRSTEGKAATSRNALQHGLARSISQFETVEAEVSKLALSILKSFNGDGAVEYARRIAEAQIDLNRVRLARHTVLSRLLPAFTMTVGSMSGLGTELSETISQNENNKRKSQNRSDQALADLSLGSETNIAVEEVTRLIAELLAIDRYEKRAFSRRKFAVREFDLSLSSSIRLRDEAAKTGRC